MKRWAKFENAHTNNDKPGQQLKVDFIKISRNKPVSSRKISEWNCLMKIKIASRSIASLIVEYLK